MTPQDEKIFAEAVKYQTEHILSKTGSMYPYNPDNLLEAIANMSEEKKTTLAYYTADRSVNGVVLLANVTIDYWTPRAEKQALEDVQEHFDPANYR